jgi:valyl-tRNA synthetase
MQVDYIDIKERTLLKVPGYDKPVEFGVLKKFAYTLEGNLGEIVVATTRIETMLGDTAIAVHPADDRYSQFRGKYAVHPFSGRKIPIICDAILVDPKFGTGAVKVFSILFKIKSSIKVLFQVMFVHVMMLSLLLADNTSP